jgi:tRNA(fMet)-specific endonuclease VapC
VAVILDTNAVSSILAGDEGIAAVLEVAMSHHLPAIVLGEYRYGLKRSRKRSALTELLDRLEEESIVLVVDGETSKHYADVREALRKKATPIPENDVWIAALAVQHRQPIVSRDAHFDSVEGLTRITWRVA